MLKHWTPAVAVPILSSLRRPSVGRLCRNFIIFTLGVAFATSSMPAIAQSFTTFDPPGSMTTNPTAINSAGVVTGWYIASTGNHAFVLTKGVITSFDGPGAIGT